MLHLEAQAGLQGGAAGIFAASSTWYMLQRTGKLPVAWSAPKHWMLATFVSGALASFLCSLAAGKNSVQRIGHIFRRGAHDSNKHDDDSLEPPSLSRYQQIMIQNRNALDDTGFDRRSEVLARHRAKSGDVPPP